LPNSKRARVETEDEEESDNECEDARTNPVGELIHDIAIQMFLLTLIIIPVKPQAQKPI
jgi:hypothetical protein